MQRSTNILDVKWDALAITREMNAAMHAAVVRACVLAYTRVFSPRLAMSERSENSPILHPKSLSQVRDVTI